MRKKLLAVLAGLGLGATALLTAVPAQATNPPSNLVIDQITNTTFHATWQTVTSATEYQVYTNGVYAGTSTTAEETVDNLTACTQYYVQVKAKAGGVWSALATGSGSKTITTTGCSTPPPSSSGSAATDLGWGTPISAGSDEFNYTGAPDSTKWNNYNDIPGHAGNGRRMAAQSTVNGTELVQTGLSGGDTGYLSSKYRPGTMYGKWETRMKVNNRDTEYHPVLLLWPDTGGDSTTDDEIDYAESTSDKTKVKFFLHYGTPGQNLTTSAEQVIDLTQYHNYAVSWSSTGVRGYIDGILWFEDTSSTHNPGQSMHQGIQLDYFPDGTSTTTSTMSVDWTRAYA